MKNVIWQPCFHLWRIFHRLQTWGRFFKQNCSRTGKVLPKLGLLVFLHPTQTS
jgi:hypothetical protein